MTIPRTTYIVSTKAALSDAVWTSQPDLICTQLTTGLAPTIDQAVLLFRFGHITKEGAPLNAYVEQLELRGKFVRIEIPSAAVDWVGYIVSEAGDRWPVETTNDDEKRLYGGDQQFVAVGLEWFLTQQKIEFSPTYDAAGTIESPRLIGYNTGFGDGREVSYVDAGNKYAANLLFAPTREFASKWTAGDICRSLLQYHTPRKNAPNNADPFPCSWIPSASITDYLGGFYPIVPTVGRTVYDVLNSIINPRRGLVWYLRYNNAFNFVALDVDSMSTAAIALPGGGTLPAVTRAIALNAIDDDSLVHRLTIEKNETRRTGQVVVRGAMRRAVFTVGVPAGNLVRGWRVEDEAAYKIAAIDEAGYGALSLDAKKLKNDRWREAGQYERVYTTFVIPPDWDGKCGDGSATAADNACPYFVQGSESQLGVEKLNVSGLRLLRSMPIKVGYDYDDAANPTSRDPDDANAEWQRPFAVLDIDGTNKWRFGDTIGASEEAAGLQTSYHLQAINGSPGFQLLPSRGMPHSLAKNHFDSGSHEPSRYDPEVSFNTLRATVCGEWDEYCRGSYPTNTATAPGYQKRVYIDIGEKARFDWLAQNTIYDVQNGSLKTVATGGALRDDRPLCRDLAQIAYEWYSTDRAHVEIQFRALTNYGLFLGTLITTIGEDAAETTVNAMISQMSFSPEANSVSVSAGFAELDVAGLI